MALLNNGIPSPLMAIGGLYDSATVMLEHISNLKEMRAECMVTCVRGSKLAEEQRSKLADSNFKDALRVYAQEHHFAAYLFTDMDLAFLHALDLETKWLSLSTFMDTWVPDATLTWQEWKLDDRFEEAIEWVAEKSRSVELRGKPLSRPAEAFGLFWCPETFRRAQSMRSSRSRPLILIVEDNYALRQLAGSILRKQGEVAAAHHAVSAIEKYCQLAPDLVFLDIAMPDWDGITVLRFLQEQDPNAHIVMFSANTGTEILREAFESGAKGYVAKPFTAEALLKHVRFT
jgi:two-component system, chemotaxis family, chemotaxis protein CheY